jgi:hypothetical protein
MAVELTPRLGIHRWPLGTDPYTRGHRNSDADRLELLAAMDAQGTLAGRPAPAPANRGLYYAVVGDADPAENGRLYRSDGATWARTGLSLTGGDTITASAAGVIPLVVRGAASQTANLLEARDDAGTRLSSLDRNGTFITGLTASASSYVFGGPAAGENTRIATYAADRKGLVVRGAASQTANLAEFQNDAGTALLRVSAGGNLITNRGTFLFGSADGNATEMFVTAATATQRPLVVRGAASQTANLAEFQNSAGTVLAGVGANGDLFGNQATYLGPVDFSTQTNGLVRITSRGPGEHPLTVQGRASQTADLVQFRDSAGNVRLGVNAAGRFFQVDGGVTRVFDLDGPDTAGTGFRRVRVPN